MEHSGVGEASGMDRPGLPRSRLIAGADVDNPTPQSCRIAAGPPAGIRTAGLTTWHAQLCRAAIRACKDERTEAAERIGGRPVALASGRGQPTARRLNFSSTQA